MKIIKTIFLFIIVVHAAYAVRLGIENDATEIHTYRPLRIGFITNQTGLTQEGQRSVDVLRARGFNIVLLLAPEHGISGGVPAGQTVSDHIDHMTKLPVVSLYADGARAKEIPTHLAQRIDTLFFDIQDSGMRHYTYISTLYKALEFCAQYGLPLVVFDRPNPLGGIMEGPLVEPSLTSFISIAPIPLRHGLTIGELAQYFNEQCLRKPAILRVVPMLAYHREPLSGSLLAPLSPNIKTLSSCFGYSFLGILGEVGVFIGVHTQRPFGVLMLEDAFALPPYQLFELRLILQRCGVASVPARFINQHDRHYRGLALSIEHIMQVSAFTCLVNVLDFLRRAGVSLKPSALFDKAVGTTIIQDMLKGKATIADVARVVNEPLQQFARVVRPYLLYEPAPQVVPLQST